MTKWEYKYKPKKYKLPRYHSVDRQRQIKRAETKLSEKAKRFDWRETFLHLVVIVMYIFLIALFFT